MLGGCGQTAAGPVAEGAVLPLLARIKGCGPASKVAARLHVACVRRKGEYGMWWPGAVWDGEAARESITAKIKTEAQALGMQLDLRPEPIYSNEEADAWVAECAAAKPDGLLLVMLDRQQHAWPTAKKAVDTGLRTIIYSPVGTSFTTNTAPLAAATNAVIYSTDDFSQVAQGMRIIQAGVKMRAARCLVLRGGERKDAAMEGLGIGLQYLPAATFLDLYNQTPTDGEIRTIAEAYLRGARRVAGATRDDILNGVKSYVVARRLLAQEQADAITMDCLGALGKSKVSLPCIAWSRMNDDGIPAACEADLGAVASHIVVQYLCGRPGFQQDPVAETAQEAIIGAHCSCATRLNGPEAPAEPYDIIHHHGNRDAVPRTLWREGQEVTSIDVMPGKTPKMLIATGRVLGNVDVPPAGGCVVSVMVKFDGTGDVLAWPGFHQVFFYGNWRRVLADFCRLHGIEAQIV
jgi:hypothetical protein